jgi:hypothetical protein
MEDLQYCKPKGSEWKSMLIICSTLAFMFSIMFLRFGNNIGAGFLDAFLNFFVFFIVLFYFKQSFMKLMALRDGYELIIRQSMLDEYGFRPYDKLSYWSEITQKNVLAVSKTVYNKVIDNRKQIFRNKGFEFKGIPASVLSIFLYILTLGFLIYPDMWSYKTKKIPHRFTNTVQRFDSDPLGNLFNVRVSDYRLSKSLTIGFLSYFVFGIILKLFLEDLSSYYNWFVFALYWVAFVTLIPLPSSEGFELWRKNLFAWIMVLTVLIIGMISLLVFSTVKFTLLSVFFFGLVMFFYKVYCCTYLIQERYIL